MRSHYWAETAEQEWVGKGDFMWQVMGKMAWPLRSVAIFKTSRAEELLPAFLDISKNWRAMGTSQLYLSVRVIMTPGATMSRPFLPGTQGLLLLLTMCLLL